MVAAEKTPSVKAGQDQGTQATSAPPVGIQPSFTAKSMMSMMPSQKAGHALAQQGQHPDHGIGDAVALHSRHNACRDAQYHGDEQGRTGQRQGGRRPLRTTDMAGSL